MMRLRTMKLAASSGVGAMMSVTILRPTGPSAARPDPRTMTDCIKKPFSHTSCVDQRRPNQPMSSIIPASTAVGKSQCVRMWMAWVTCAAAFEAAFSPRADALKNVDEPVVRANRAIIIRQTVSEGT
jgi:hypothetical protein